MTVPLITADLSVTSTDGNKTILPHTAFSLNAGQIMALVGPSGCGKTTLFESLVGALPRGGTVHGSVLIDGCDPLSLSDRELALFRRSQVALVGQDPGAELPPLMTVNAMLKELTPNADVPALLSRVDLPQRAAHLKIHQLSGGQQRRVALARALVRCPKVIALDEPFAGLDPATTEVIWRLLRQVADQGTAVVMTEHHLPSRTGFVDQVVHIGEESAPHLTHTLSGSPSVDSDPVLRVKDLDFCTLAGIPLFSGLSFCVHAGQILGIKGASGSGKSTLLRCLIGTERAESGEIALGDVRRRARSTWPRTMRRMLQIIPQDPASTLNPKMPAIKAVSRAVAASGGAAHAQARALKLLNLVGISAEQARRVPAELSGG